MRKIKLKGNMLEVRRSSLITSLWRYWRFCKISYLYNYFNAQIISVLTKGLTYPLLQTPLGKETWIILSCPCFKFIIDFLFSC